MKEKIVSCLLLFAFSCMPYTVTEKYAKRTGGFGHGHQDLSVYSSTEFDGQHIKMAQIKMKHSVIHGNLEYDQRMKNFLLQAINDFDGCAIVNDESLTDDVYYYFDIISLTHNCKIKNTANSSDTVFE